MNNFLVGKYMVRNIRNDNGFISRVTDLGHIMEFDGHYYFCQIFSIGNGHRPKCYHVFTQEYFDNNDIALFDDMTSASEYITPYDENYI